MSRVMDVLGKRDLYSVEPHMTAAEVAHRMAELRVGAILVIKDGELKGLFSERDFLVRVVVGGRDADRTTVAEVMTSNVASIEETASMEDAMETTRPQLPASSGDAQWTRDRFPVHARPHELRAGTEDGGAAPHARLHPQQRHLNQVALHR